MTQRKPSDATPPSGRVRSLAEIRGRYGLAEERFEVLEEGPRDRRTGTVLGRRQRAPAPKFVATSHSVMGTARLETPAEVQGFAEEAPDIPLQPMRWWPLLVGALVPVVIVILAMRDAPATAARGAASGDVAAPASPRPGDAALGRKPELPQEAPVAVDSKSRPPTEGTASAPTGSASGGAPTPRANHLPDFPDLEDP